EERRTEPELIDLAYAHSLPLVATNEPFFAAREDFEAHDALICIAEGAMIIEENRRRLTPEYHFKTRGEMVALFADLPEAVANTVEIARRCSYRPIKHKPILPRFAGGEGDADADSAEAAVLTETARTGLARRLEVHGTAPGFSREDYESRLAFELGVIERMKYPGY